MHVDYFNAHNVAKRFTAGCRELQASGLRYPETGGCGCTRCGHQLSFRRTFL